MPAITIEHDQGVPLQEWANAHEPPEEMIYRNCYWDQIMFVRDRLSGLFYDSSEERMSYPVRVVGEHVSKSIALPVYSIIVPDWLEVRLRANFHNWVVSVLSASPVPDRFLDLFERETQQLQVHSEGFSPEWVFPPYASNQHQFSLCLGDEFQLYTFCYLLLAGLDLRGGLKP